MGISEAHLPARKRLGWGMTGLVTVLAVLVSPHLGRATPSGGYRPQLPVAALASGCYPLPSGVDLDLPYQVREDGNVGPASLPRRRLVAQWDLVDPATARARILASFERAGFVPAPDSGPDRIRLTRPDVGLVGVTLTPLPGASSTSVVQGRLVLDLPVQPLASGEADCGSPYVTKRFA